jgi:hypothetical protein
MDCSKPMFHSFRLQSQLLCPAPGYFFEDIPLNTFACHGLQLFKFETGFHTAASTSYETGNNDVPMMRNKNRSQRQGTFQDIGNFNIMNKVFIPH